jgi:hypothetical protein
MKTLLMLVVLAVVATAQPDTCVVRVQAYENLLALGSRACVHIEKTIPLTTRPFTMLTRPRSDTAGTDGVLYMHLLRNSVVYMWSKDVPGLARTAPGTPIPIPDADSAVFQTLLPTTSVPASYAVVAANPYAREGTDSTQFRTMRSMGGVLFWRDPLDASRVCLALNPDSAHGINYSSPDSITMVISARGNKDSTYPKFEMQVRDYKFDLDARGYENVTAYMGWNILGATAGETAYWHEYERNYFGATEWNIQTIGHDGVSTRKMHWATNNSTGVSILQYFNVYFRVESSAPFAGAVFWLFPNQSVTPGMESLQMRGCIALDQGWIRTASTFTAKASNAYDSLSNTTISYVDATAKALAGDYGATAIGTDSVQVTVTGVSLADKIMITYGPNAYAASLLPLSWDVSAENRLTIFGTSGMNVIYHRLKP